MTSTGRQATPLEASRDTLSRQVGRRIRAARLEQGLSLAQLGGDRLSRSFLSLVETGRSRISLRALAIVAEQLDLPVSYFLEGMTLDGADELVLARAEAALARQEPERCLRLLATLSDETPLPPRALWIKGQALLATGEAEAALTTLRAGLACATEIRDDVLSAQLYESLGSALLAAREVDGACACFRQGLDLLSEGPDHPLLHAKLTRGLGHVYRLRGDMDNALRHYERAASLSVWLSDLETVGRMYAALSNVYDTRGDLHTAQALAQRGAALFSLQQERRSALREHARIMQLYPELDQSPGGDDAGREGA